MASIERRSAEGVMTRSPGERVAPAGSRAGLPRSQVAPPQSQIVFEPYAVRSRDPLPFELGRPLERSGRVDAKTAPVDLVRVPGERGDIGNDEGVAVRTAARRHRPDDV